MLSEALKWKNKFSIVTMWCLQFFSQPGKTSLNFCLNTKHQLFCIMHLHFVFPILSSQKSGVKYREWMITNNFNGQTRTTSRINRSYSIVQQLETPIFKAWFLSAPFKVHNKKLFCDVPILRKILLIFLPEDVDSVDSLSGKYTTV